jgi:ATP-dependent Clp protease ATP-binding subunit ClpC
MAERGWTLDPACETALLLAANSLLSPSASVGVSLLLSALCHAGGFANRYPELAAAVRAPVPVRNVVDASSVQLTASVRRILNDVARRGEERRVTAEVLFRALVASDEGRKALCARGVPDGVLDTLAQGDVSHSSDVGASKPRAAVTVVPDPGNAPIDLPATQPDGVESQGVDVTLEMERLVDVLAGAKAEPGGWRSSPGRDGVLRSLSAFGRVLTLEEQPDHGITGIDAPLRALVRTLAKMRRRNAIVLGFPGTGKSAFIQEVARRIVVRHHTIPRRLQEMDIFELSPVFLRSGASVRGEFEERAKRLVDVLTANRAVILFIDEIHLLIRSEIHDRSAFGEGGEVFKAALGRGDITCIGCTTPAEYRYHIEPDGALVRRFGLIRLDPPNLEATRKILMARRPRVEAHFTPLKIPDAMLDRTIALSEEHLSSRYQPDKSIQLLDEACAFCATEEPPLTRLTESALRAALADMLGRGIVDGRELTEVGVFERLRERLVGQDEVLRLIARAFVAGLGSWVRSSAPRGVFLFAGPTGVGKTESALILAEQLGADSQGLIRIDCSTLQGQGDDGGPSVYRLLGVPAPYIGYVRGKGGLLSVVRDRPECVILFDEFEKAHPDVARLLLRIIDEGVVEDSDANTLDFRRSFFIFTTNAGVSSDRRAVVGYNQAPEVAGEPRCDAASVLAALRAHGIGDEFLGRLNHVFVFQPLAREAMAQVVERQLQALAESALQRRLKFSWDPEVVEYLTTHWQPRFGARALSSILRSRVSEQLSIAEAQGEMKGVRTIHLRVMDLERRGDLAGMCALASREVDGPRLVVSLA